MKAILFVFVSILIVTDVSAQNSRRRRHAPVTLDSNYSYKKYQRNYTNEKSIDDQTKGVKDSVELNKKGMYNNMNYNNSSISLPPNTGSNGK